MVGQLRDEGVVVGDLGAEVAQEADDPQRRRFAGVADPRLVGGAEDQDPRALHRLAGAVQSALDPPHAELRLRLIDLARQLDELRVEVVLARLEGEVEGVDREAVAAHPGAGLEAHEAERLGRRRVDHLPDVDPEPVAELGDFVDQGDVDRAEDVLQELCQLGGLRRADDLDRVADLRVEGGGALGAGGGDAADQLRRGADRVVGAARDRSARARRRGRSPRRPCDRPRDRPGAAPRGWSPGRRSTRGRSAGPAAGGRRSTPAASRR